MLSATCIVVYCFFLVTSPLVTSPLDPSLIPLYDALVIAIIIAGALLPPVAALITGALACIDVACIATFQPHTAAYTQMIKQGATILFLILPICIQIVVAVVVYVIMRNLLQTIRRADRAEEIADLRQELMKQALDRANEQEQLEEGIEAIAQIHARVANGDLNARVPLNADNVLWQVAVPLNNLLNRIKALNDKVIQFDQISNAINQVTRHLQRTRRAGEVPEPLPATGTALDPILLEYNRNIATREQTQKTS